MEWKSGVVVSGMWMLAACGEVRDGNAFRDEHDGGSGGASLVDASRPPPESLPDTGPTPPAPAADASPTPRPVADAGPTPPQPVADAGPTPEPAADAGLTPPEYCVPSCLWDAIRVCTPPPADLCLGTFPTPVSIPPPRMIVCDPESGWTQTEAHLGQAGTHLTLVHDGVECLSVASGGASPFPGWTFYKGGVGIGYMAYDGTEARCGAFNTPAIVLEPGWAECKRWTGPDAPSLFPLISCTTEKAGDCGSVP